MKEPNKTKKKTTKPVEKKSTRKLDAKTDKRVVKKKINPKLIKKRREYRKRNNIYKIIDFILLAGLLILTAAIIIGMIELDMLPTFYLALIISVLLIMFAIPMSLLIVLQRRNPALVIIGITLIILNGIYAFGYSKLSEAVSFIGKNLCGNIKETLVYDIVASSSYTYDDSSDITGKELIGPEDTEYKDEIEDAILDLSLVTFGYEGTTSTLVEELETNTSKVIFVPSEAYDYMVENDETVSSYSKVLETVTITIEIEKEESDVSVAEEPFIIYLSGIDTRSGYLDTYSLSDVNMVMVVNPVKKSLLMIHIPRDYYVQLPGTTGLKDKLTHAGLRGGVELSKKTVEQILDIDVDKYIKVNFNAVIKLVDAVGGITLYNDLNKSFTCWTDSSCTFKPGNNTVGGKCALAFARERYAYATGDVHRGQNQQQVIEALLNKITSSKTLVLNYSNILSALNGSFATDLTDDDISDLVKMELKDMATWTTTKFSLTGTDGYTVTASYPNQQTYVMYPSESKIAEAKELIREAMEID